MTKEIHEAPCPLCAAPARFVFEDYGHFKHFLCPVCVEFEISNATERIVLQMPKEARDALSQASKAAGETKLLSIRRPIGDEDRHQSLVTKVIPRAEARGRYE